MTSSAWLMCSHTETLYEGHWVWLGSGPGKVSLSLCFNFGVEYTEYHRLKEDHEKNIFVFVLLIFTDFCYVL